MHPAYLEDSEIVNEEIIGKWRSNSPDEKDPQQLEISKKKDDEFYKLTWLVDDDVFRFEGILFKVGDNLYFDLLLEMEQCSEVPKELLILLIPVHTIAKISIEKDKLLFSIIDFVELQKFIEKYPDYFRIETTELHTLIISPSEKIQDFLKFTSSNEKLFDEVSFLRH